MNILGIIMSTNSTAALLQDGRITACASEERFVGLKNTSVYPQNAVEYCLSQAGLAASDLDQVALCGQKDIIDYLVVDHDATFSIKDKIKEQHEYWRPLLYEGRQLDYLEVFKDKIVQEMEEPFRAFGSQSAESDFRTFLVRRHLGPEVKISRYHHHDCHVHYGVLTDRNYDPEADYLVFTMEGFGDDANASVAVYQGGRFRYLMKTPDCYLGRLYRYVTLIMGLKPNEHEYKVMGLAPYASKYTYAPALTVFEQTMYVDQSGGFSYQQRPQDLYFHFRDALEGVRFDGIAGGLQTYTENIILDWVRHHVAQSGISRLAFSGGVGMNIKALMEVAKLPQVESLWAGPSLDDTSLAVGACYKAYLDNGGADPQTLTNTYLGPEPLAVGVEQAARQAKDQLGYSVRQGYDAKEIASLLEEGKIVARCEGRMEFGARALGNRSIIADPRDADTIKRINQAIKMRDFWMPFAPVILDEWEAQYLENPKGLSMPYMALGCHTTPQGQRDLKAALHPADLTARPQVISREENPGYYDIVKSFAELTGVGGLLNTSFNLHGEPIVNTAEEALRVFRLSDLDVLLLGGWLISK